MTVSSYWSPNARLQLLSSTLCNSSFLINHLLSVHPSFQCITQQSIVPKHMMENGKKWTGWDGWNGETDFHYHVEVPESPGSKRFRAFNPFIASPHRLRPERGSISRPLCDSSCHWILDENLWDYRVSVDVGTMWNVWCVCVVRCLPTAEFSRRRPLRRRRVQCGNTSCRVRTWRRVSCVASWWSGPEATLQTSSLTWGRPIMNTTNSWRRRMDVRRWRQNPRSRYASGWRGSLQYESKKSPPPPPSFFWHFFSNGWNF